VNRYPLFLDLTGRRVLVVGGGAVATRRVPRLAGCGADVVVVAPSLSDELRALAQEGALKWEPRGYDVGDLAGASLVLTCTGEPGVDAAVAGEAAARGVWCARADDAAASAAWVPAVGTVDDVTFAVTAGGDPRRARRIRDRAVSALRAGDLRARRGRGAAGGVVLVGGGPGHPDLITLGGFRALLDADVVVADRLGPTELLGSLPAEVEVVDVGKRPRGPAASQDDINALLVARARLGQRVVRLKGGDPFVYGRGGDEVEACLAAGVPVRVVPGVSSVTAAPGLAGIPLTQRGITQHFAVASGHAPPGDPRSTVDWRALASGGGTLVLLMAVENRAAIAAELIAGGRGPATPVAVIENASSCRERVAVTTLDGLAAEPVSPPATIVVGEVVRLASASGAP
jgi:uroporphyrin-III C-methyltransferase/precorrin-2 dehydrogenase/sirohydrochlorin ferrochelatase